MGSAVLLRKPGRERTRTRAERQDDLVFHLDQRLPPGFGRAETEGRIPHIESDPARLGTLAASHAQLRPDAPEWTALRVVRRLIVVVDRKSTGEVRTEVLAEWRAS